MDRDDAFTGCWDGPLKVRGLIEHVSHDGAYVAGIRFEGENLITHVTAASFMLATTQWLWEQKCVRDDDHVLVTIVDDGPGVPTDVRDKLFDPYFTTKTSGTGLGLAICRRLVEAHGGTIRLDATRVGETRFLIRLPLAKSR